MLDFQGKLLDSSNNPRNGSFDMTFSVFDAATGGSALWSEPQAVTVDAGVFQVQLGAVVGMPPGLFNRLAAYLEVQVASDPPLAPRQMLSMSPYAFRALLADDLAPGNTSYVQVTSVLQPGAVFHVSSATVAGPFTATRTSSFTASGSQTYSLVASSGVRLQSGTLAVAGPGGLVASGGVRAATVTAVTGFELPQGPGINDEGSARWEPAQNLLFIGTGTAQKTLLDTVSTQTVTNKTVSSGGANLVDATRIRTGPISIAAPVDGMTIKWNAATSQWTPVQLSTIASITHKFTPSANVTVVANSVYVVPMEITGLLQLSEIRFRVTTRRFGSSGDVGLYDSSGNLVASGGAGSADTATVGAKTVAVQGAPVTVYPGQYYAAFTCNNTPSVRGTTLGGVGSDGVVKGLGIASEAGGTTLPSSISVAGIVDNADAIFMGFNE